jgi:hypothetical protein
MLEYTVYMLEMSAQDQQSLQLDNQFIPSPVIEERRAHSFRLPVEYTILFGF